MKVSADAATNNVAASQSVKKSAAPEAASAAKDPDRDGDKESGESSKAAKQEVQKGSVDLKA